MSDLPAKTVGILQPGRIGDVLICLPIAKYLAERGEQVIWPVFAGSCEGFSQAAPYVEFVPMTGGPLETWAPAAREILQRRRCESVVDLAFGFLDSQSDGLYREFQASGEPFDLYKYRLAGVPFQEKWKLAITRDARREADLFQNVTRGRKYIVTHLQGSSWQRHLRLPWRWLRKYDIVAIDEKLTPSIFDWLMVLEKADKLILIDSCFANLVEQLNFTGEKYFVRRSEHRLTPVLKNEWKVITPLHVPACLKGVLYFTRRMAPDWLWWRVA